VTFTEILTIICLYPRLSPASAHTHYGHPHHELAGTCGSCCNYPCLGSVPTYIAVFITVNSALTLLLTFALPLPLLLLPYAAILSPPLLLIALPLPSLLLILFLALPLRTTVFRASS
jgi:hypothetical protein